MFDFFKFSSPEDPEKPLFFVGQSCTTIQGEPLKWVGVVKEEDRETWHERGWHDNQLWNFSHFAKKKKSADPFEDDKMIFYPLAGRAVFILEKDEEFRVCTRLALRGEEHISERWPLVG